ncbi:MAG: hypothetical protein IKL73_07740 [Lachnospiraceae bacterium]|nr:hypothetical protein [Lachnospira sp.]MBR6698135.1 hypothetical protein [Lachnospiraceae bacterium]
MGLFGLFGKKKKIKKIIDNSEHYEYGLEMEKVDLETLEGEELNKYVRVREEQIKESCEMLAKVKEEYKIVSSYLSDIQLIDLLDGAEKNKIVEIAKEIQSLTVDRKIYQTTESKISNGRYILYEKYEDEIPDAVVKLQNDEKYYETVKNDMKMMDATKFEIRCDIKDAQASQRRIKHLSTISIIFLITIFAAFIITNLSLGNDTSRDTAFLVVILVAAIFVVMLLVKLQNIVRVIKESEKKLNRAIMIHNKVKIKYVNIVASIEFQREKYDVVNAYELSHYYGLFLETKRERQKYQQTTQRLNQLLNTLNDILTSLNLYDPSVWQNDIWALIEPKEMVEVRHRYNVRRQKLREQIEKYTESINEAKETLTMLTNKKM